MTTTKDRTIINWPQVLALIASLAFVSERLDKRGIHKRDNTGRMKEADRVVRYVKDLTGWSLWRIAKNPDKAITLYLKSNNK